MRTEDRTARPERKRGPRTPPREDDAADSAPGFTPGPIVDSIRSRRPPCADSDNFARFVREVRVDTEADTVQAKVDAATRDREIDYQHLWFGWELLRRSPLWSACAWWQRGGRPIGVAERALQESFHAIVGPVARERPHAPMPGSDPVRSFSFPEPEQGGGCPEGRGQEERVLWALLKRFTFVPVHVQIEGPWPFFPPALGRGPPLVPVVINLASRDAAILAAIDALRAHHNVRPVNVGPRSRDVWGTSRYSAIRAVELLRHVEAGESVKDWGRAMARTAENQVAEVQIREARRTLLNLGEMIFTDPLRVLRPPVDPRGPRDDHSLIRSKDADSPTRRRSKSP